MSGATKLAVREPLVEYGILQEKSDVRAHVSVVGRCVYVYPTSAGVSCVRSGKYRKAGASQEIYGRKEQTAVGCLVPPSDILGCSVVDIPDHIMEKANFRKIDTTTDKGKKAVRVVQWLLRAGRFPLWPESTEVTDEQMQLEGTDILLTMNLRIQVKCDWKAGDRPGCTGNLYLQTAESNPLKQH